MNTDDAEVDTGNGPDDDSGETAGEGLWGGRFRSGLHPAIHEFTNSLPFDRRLARHDLVGSLAHARTLAETGVLDGEDARAVLRGLSGLLDDVEAGEVGVPESGAPDEDVHGWIERTLGERIGEAAGRLHTGRSRNDQTGAALRLWTRDALARLADAAAELCGAWVEEAEEHRETELPGYTHLQRAQPVTLAHHLLAHAWSVLEDGRRLRSAHHAAGVSPLGAGALAGTSHDVDPERTAELLGFDRGAHPNSMLAVADRDYVAEGLFAASLLMTHLSRWAAEIVLWSSSEFGFLELEDSVAQGSSIMPQKKNPEAAEVLRGKAGRVAGRLSGFLHTLKGLPFAYNSDLQEDKEPLFDAVDTAEASLRAARVLAGGVRWRPERMREALRGGFLTATELADYLARRGVPFREAHEQVGRAVMEAEARETELWELPLEAIREACPAAGEDVFEVLSPAAACRSHDSPGGPAPRRVSEQLEEARRAVDELRAWVRERPEPPVYRAHRSGRLLEGLA